MKYPLFAIISASLSLMVVSPAFANTHRIEATYNFVWKGMLVSTADTIAEVSDATYSLDVEMRMRGLARLFVGGGKTTFAADGMIGADGSLQPQNYESRGKWKGNPYRESLTYDSQGNLTSIVKDWPEKWQQENKREPVPSALRGGHDPASLLMALIRRPLSVSEPAGGVGPASFQVFDGDTVTNWQIECGDTPVRIKRSKHAETSGEAHECTINQTLLAGERILTEKQKAKAAKQAKRRAAKAKRKGKKKAYEGPMKIWMQPVADGAYWLPIRALVPSEKGAVRVYLKQLALNDVRPEPLAAVTDSSR